MKDCHHYVIERINQDMGHSGDAGPVLYPLDPKDKQVAGDLGEVIVGCQIKVSSLIPRSFRDNFITPTVVEILEINSDLSSITVRTEHGFLYEVKSKQ